MKKIMPGWLLVFVVFLQAAGAAHAQITTYTDETAYLNALAAAGYMASQEGFEDDAAWGGVRSVFPATVSAPSVTSRGIIWTANHPLTNTITTGSGAAVTGDWGIYDPDHGSASGTPAGCDIDNPPEQCLYHDGFRGSRVMGASRLYGVGGWFSGTAGANIVVILDQTNQIGLGKVPDPPLQPQFFGIIETNGFTEYEMRETDGKVGQQRLIFADDFTFGTTCLPTGVADNNCDGVDDDCNGLADDLYAVTPTSCGVGECAGNTGQLSCVNNVEVDSCDPLAGAAAADVICDGLDNDCDGQTDEEYVVDSSCGVGACLASNIPSSCVNGVETVCQPGPAVAENTTAACTDSLDNDCDGLLDTADADCAGVCIPSGVADNNCDGIDDDCNGVADDLYAVTPTSCGVGSCAGNTGQLLCSNGTVVDSCDPLIGASVERCNDIDDDCDGLVDEDFNVGGTCINGNGACAAPGSLVCTVDGSGTVCDAIPGPPSAEVCDTLDNDCDGVVDEGNVCLIIQPGDVDGDGMIEIRDAIMALQVMTGMKPAGIMYPEADSNGDSRIGMGEILFILQSIANLRLI